MITEPQPIFPVIHQEPPARLSAEPTIPLAETLPSSLLLQAMWEKMPIGTITFSHNGEIKTANPFVCGLLGIAGSDLVGKKITELIEVVPQEPKPNEPDTNATKLQIIRKREDGSEVALGINVTHADEEGYIAFIIDETERRQFEQLSLVDPLTGLYNQREITNRLKQSLAEALRDKKSIGIAFIDIDDFKDVNSLLGHNGGNRVLVKFANRLTDNIRSYDTLGRYGGDEFVIVFPAKEKNSAAKLTSRLEKNIRTGMKIVDRDITVSASIGTITTPSDFDSKIITDDPRFAGLLKDEDFVPLIADYLINEADQGMYGSKDKGKNTTTHEQFSYEGVLNYIPEYLDKLKKQSAVGKSF